MSIIEEIRNDRARAEMAMHKPTQADEFYYDLLMEQQEQM